MPCVGCSASEDETNVSKITLALLKRLEALDPDDGRDRLVPALDYHWPAGLGLLDQGRDTLGGGVAHRDGMGGFGGLRHAHNYTGFYKDCTRIFRAPGWSTPPADPSPLPTGIDGLLQMSFLERRMGQAKVVSDFRPTNRMLLLWRN